MNQRYPCGTRIPLAQVVAYGQRLADALHYAHGRCCAHGDVQPEHLWLNETSRTSSCSAILASLAPEQLQGQALPASDQYALAVQRRPFCQRTR